MPQLRARARAPAVSGLQTAAIWVCGDLTYSMACRSLMRPGPMMATLSFSTAAVMCIPSVVSVSFLHGPQRQAGDEVALEDDEDHDRWDAGYDGHRCLRRPHHVVLTLEC